MPEINIILKHARKSRELTLAQVSKDTGIPLTTLNSWERGANFPRGKNREIIAEYYKMPKESLDYSLVNSSGGREFDIGQISQAMAQSEYETRPVMLHKSYWKMAEDVRKSAGDVDFNEMFARLLKAESK